MKVKELIDLLQNNKNCSLNFLLSNKDLIPKHFHITEIGKVEKTFIDCGGTPRNANNCLLQVWTANDVEHRLVSDKLLKIFNLAGYLELDDLDIQIEYGEKIASQYFLENVKIENGELTFVLSGKKTDCLAPDRCGITGCC